jgi:hypothetical protein
LIIVDKEEIFPDPKSDYIRQKRRQNGGEYTNKRAREREREKKDDPFLFKRWFLVTRSRFVGRFCCRGFCPRNHFI